MTADLISCGRSCSCSPRIAFLQYWDLLHPLLALQTVGLGILVVIKTPADIKKMITLWRQCLFVGVTSALGSIGWFTALTIQRVTYVKALAQIEFIFALLVSYFIFGEKSSKIEILGMVLVVSGILILLMFTK